MSYMLLALFSFVGVGLCWLVVRYGPAADDSRYLLTTDSPSVQMSKLEASRQSYFRMDGIWHRRKQVRHGSLKLTVTERL